MKDEDWQDTYRKFRRIAACKGVARIADDVPVDASNLYKLFRGEIQRPSRAVRAGIERVVKEHEQEQT
jgi:hypothetical protein